MTTTPFEGWAMLELMGHRQRIGRVQEVEMFGGKLLRIDIPTDEGDITEFYGCTSVYALRPISEEIARDRAKQYGDPRPVRPVEYRLQSPAPTSEYDHSDDDDERPF